jgi:hypothetical protein
MAKSSKLVVTRNGLVLFYGGGEMAVGRLPEASVVEAERHRNAA